MKRSLLGHACTWLLLLAQTGCSSSLLTARAPVELSQAWATENTLKTPESALYDPQRNTIYVSNINQNSSSKDGDGFISRLTPDGQVEELQWVSGLSNPKGMALYNNVLYVADTDEIVAITTQSGAVLARYTAETAKSLNDVAVDGSGNVYVTDLGGKSILLLQNGSLSTWIENTGSGKPNGIHVDGDRMIVAFINSGEVRLLDPGTKNFTDWVSGIPSADGIAETEGGDYLISSWKGEIYYVNGTGRKWLLLNTQNKNMNTADISYAGRLGLLLVPTFNDNRVVAYRLSTR